MNALDNAEGAVLPTMAPTSAPVESAEELIREGKAWGLSTAVDLHGCRPEAIRDRNQIEAYVIALCKLIRMKRFGKCQIVHFGGYDPALVEEFSRKFFGARSSTASVTMRY